MDADLSVPAPPGYDPTKSLEEQQQRQHSPASSQSGASGGARTVIKRRAAIACRRCVLPLLFVIHCPKASAVTTTLGLQAGAKFCDGQVESWVDEGSRHGC